MNWYIGQEIVCIKSHSQLVVKEGVVYKVDGLMKGCCDNKTKIDIGVKDGLDSYNCTKILCINRKHLVPNDGIWWLCESLFAPLGDISELEEILKEQPNIIEK